METDFELDMQPQEMPLILSVESMNGAAWHNYNSARGGNEALTSNIPVKNDTNQSIGGEVNTDVTPMGAGPSKMFVDNSPPMSTMGLHALWNNDATYSAMGAPEIPDVEEPKPEDAKTENGTDNENVREPRSPAPEISDTNDPFYGTVIKFLEQILKAVPKITHVITERPKPIDLQFKEFEGHLSNFELYVRRKSIIIYQHLHNLPTNFDGHDKDFYPADRTSVRRFNKLYSINENCLWYMDGPLFTCILCPERCQFKVRIGLYEHLNGHFRHFYICKYCSGKFCSIKAMNVHIKLRHALIAPTVRTKIRQVQNDPSA